MTASAYRSSATARRGLALGVAALALLPIGVLAGCGNGAVKQRSDTRPEPHASTAGVRSVYPTAAPPTPEGPYVSPLGGVVPSLESTPSP